MTRETNANDQPTLSIGALSQATGIPKETLRTWERRYGFPSPERNAAGHRVYSMRAVSRLRLMSAAIDAGHRPSNIVGEDESTLRALLRTTTASAAPAAAPADEAGSADQRWQTPWLQAAAAFDGDRLEDHFYRAWNKFGGLRFLHQRVGPFLTALGDAWADGRLHVSHEHFTSERLRDFLTRQWRPLSDRAHGPTVVLANLPGEQHCLGLHMAAVVVALAGCRVSFLGADTPLDEIVVAANQQESTAVLISVSLAYDQRRARDLLDALAASIDQQVRLVVGGGGRPVANGVELHIEDWNELYDWARQLARDNAD